MSSQNSVRNILDGSNLLGNLEFLNNLNEGRNLLHTQLAARQNQQASPLFQPFAPSQQTTESKLDVFAQLQQLVSSNNSNQQQQQAQTMTFPKQHTTIHNKILSREKKKFSADVSDFLVLEVLKRKELLVENNTSRDLSFSECKRNAWNDVKELLVTRFLGFDLNIEAIKSHWRYRKRKVTDAYSEMCKGGDVEQKLKARLPTVDFEIYNQLKDSNLLERSRNELATSPIDGDDGHFESISSSNSPATTTTTFTNNNNADSSTMAMPNLPLISQAPFFLNSMGQHHQHQIGITNPTILLERLTASLLEQQLKQQQQIKKEEEEDEQQRTEEIERRIAGTQILVEHDGTASSRERRSQSASTTMSNLSGTMPECQNSGHAKENGGGADGEPAQKRPRLAGVEDTDAKEERGMALLKREAYMAQASAFDEIRTLMTEVRSTLLPQMLSALQNYNSQFQPQN
uniref:Regulatory protein zeste n=1 Tax=Globodera rostochiensis TaxID=31243 RepID=A0A914H5S0_GLORO